MEQLLIGKYQIKSKYTGEWQARQVSINFIRNLVGISGNDGSPFKYFSISQVHVEKKAKNILKITPTSRRTYELKGENIEDLRKVLESSKVVHKIANQTSVVTFQIPKKIDYCKILKKELQDQQKAADVSKSKIKMSKTKVYPRQKSYLREQDWAINDQDGGLILISEQKKKNQGKIIKFVLKKFVTTGSFMGISFPVFAMKPESILETYCKSISAAPLIFTQCSTEPVQRLKKFTCFCFTISRLFSDIDKPFNPTIGQTFQANIAGGLFSAEQTSHHPPQSSIHFQGDGYVIYGTLELVAHIGINSATGMIQGDLFVQFKDGEKIVGRLFSGEMSGFLIGQNKFKPDSSCYAYDKKEKIICSYKFSEGDNFLGHIGRLNQVSQSIFQNILKSKERFTGFKAQNQRQFRQVLSKVEGSWTRDIKFDQKTYLDFQDPAWLPYQPTVCNFKLLDSDSRHRLDIKLRQLQKFEESQQQKQRIEEQQRANRKLRANYHKKTSK